MPAIPPWASCSPLASTDDAATAADSGTDAWSIALKQLLPDAQQQCGADHPYQCLEGAARFGCSASGCAGATVPGIVEMAFVAPQPHAGPRPTWSAGGSLRGRGACGVSIGSVTRNTAPPSG